MRFPDGLRAVAAMLVILPHSIGLFAYWPFPSAFTRSVIRVAEMGGLGVQIFFVLSGFVIAFSLREAVFSARYIGNFILRRSVRLDPPYWAAILFYLGFIALQRNAGHAIVPGPSAPQLLAHLFYLQDILGYGDINVVFWTLCIEIQFYLAFCLLLWAVQRWPWRRLPFLALFACSIAWPAGWATEPYRGSFLPFWYAFLSGAIVYWATTAQLPRWCGFASTAGIWILAAGKHDSGACVVAITATALIAASYRGNLYRWLDTPPLQLLGRLSYCLYLFHVPVSAVMLAALVRFAPTHEYVSYLFLALSVLLIITVAFIMHRCIEVPSLRWSRRLKSYRST